jgi:hypothetical protein
MIGDRSVGIRNFGCCGLRYLTMVRDSASGECGLKSSVSEKIVHPVVFLVGKAAIAEIISAFQARLISMKRSSLPQTACPRCYGQ